MSECQQGKTYILPVFSQAEAFLAIELCGHSKNLHLQYESVSKSIRTGRLERELQI
jgi:hypothetical protein